MSDIANYELTVIVNTDAVSEEKQDIRTKIEGMIVKLKGKMEEIDEWGERPMVYPIKKQEKGYYLHYLISIDPEQTNELQARLGRLDNVLRWLLVKPEEEE